MKFTIFQELGASSRTTHRALVISWIFSCGNCSLISLTMASFGAMTLFSDILAFARKTKSMVISAFLICKMSVPILLNFEIISFARQSSPRCSRKPYPQWFWKFLSPRTSVCCENAFDIQFCQMALFSFFPAIKLQLFYCKVGPDWSGLFHKEVDFMLGIRMLSNCVVRPLYPSILYVGAISRRSSHLDGVESALQLKSFVTLYHIVFTEVSVTTLPTLGSVHFSEFMVIHIACTYMVNPIGMLSCVKTSRVSKLQVCFFRHIAAGERPSKKSKTSGARLLSEKLYSTWTRKIGIKTRRQVLPMHRAPNKNMGKKGSVARNYPKVWTSLMSSVFVRQNSGKDHMSTPCTKKVATAKQRGIWRNIFTSSRIRMKLRFILLLKQG